MKNVFNKLLFVLDAQKRKKLFYFNKSLYKTFFSKYLKHSKSPNKPWYEVLNKYIEKIFNQLFPIKL